MFLRCLTQGRRNNHYWFRTDQPFEQVYWINGWIHSFGQYFCVKRILIRMLRQFKWSPHFDLSNKGAWNQRRVLFAIAEKLPWPVPEGSLISVSNALVLTLLLGTDQTLKSLCFDVAMNNSSFAPAKQPVPSPQSRWSVFFPSLLPPLLKAQCRRLVDPHPLPQRSADSLRCRIGLHCRGQMREAANLFPENILSDFLNEKDWYKMNPYWLIWRMSMILL